MAISTTQQENSGTARESRLFLGQMIAFNASPNMEYLVRTVRYPLSRQFSEYRFRRDHMTLHENGWLEIDVPLSEEDLRTRTENKIDSYRKIAQMCSLSPWRLQSLKETAGYLKGRGRVMLVRLPASKEMRDLEMEYMPEFDRLMTQLAEVQEVDYLSLIEDYASYSTTDGNHLSRDSARNISRRLNDYLKEK